MPWIRGHLDVILTQIQIPLQTDGGYRLGHLGEGKRFFPELEKSSPPSPLEEVKKHNLRYDTRDAQARERGWGRARGRERGGA